MAPCIVPPSTQASCQSCPPISLCPPLSANRTPPPESRLRPAPVSHALNIDLLRGHLGFNGVIVSDASVMAGSGSWSSLTQAKVDLIANGCDVILFSFNPEAERQAVLDAIAAGRIRMARIDDAVTRILALKAALGLHQGRGLPQPDWRARIGTAANRDTAAQTCLRAPTLVKHTQNLFPPNPATHRRGRVISGGIISPIHPDPAPFVLPDLLAARGFAVTRFQPGTRVNPARSMRSAGWRMSGREWVARWALPRLAPPRLALTNVLRRNGGGFEDGKQLHPVMQAHGHGRPPGDAGQEPVFAAAQRHGDPRPLPADQRHNRHRQDIQRRQTLWGGQ